MQPATITVDRDKTVWTDRARAYKVLVDGEDQATVRSGASATITVPPGEHTIEVRIDWCSSPAVHLEVTPGSTHRLRCRANANPLTVLYYTLLARNRYLALWLA